MPQLKLFSHLALQQHKSAVRRAWVGEEARHGQNGAQEGEDQAHEGGRDDGSVCGRILTLV